MRLRAHLLPAVLLVRLAVAQSPDTAHGPITASVRGVVHDSIAHTPLRGAMVQLVDADRFAHFARTAVTDSSGHFVLGGVPNGRYTLGFFHPVLDSIGLEPTLREVYITGQRSMVIDLATPSPSRLRAAICGGRPTADSGGVLLGVVRDARDGAPVGGATVNAEWLELSLRRTGMARRIARRSATSTESGWFAICNVPTPGVLTVTAMRAADSTDHVELEVPPEGFLRRELYVGTARPVAAVDTTGRTNAATRPERAKHVGEGRLTGTITAAVDGRPLSGAIVSIADGPQTRTNERGEWSLADVPSGTRMLAVRAVSYYPHQRAVDVVAESPPLRISLTTLRAVLDTIKITAPRFMDYTHFEERRRKATGRYITARDIQAANVMTTSEIFRSLPGVQFNFDSTYIEKRMFVRGNMMQWCEPAIYMDGFRISGSDGIFIPGISDDDLDSWVRPDEIAGVEVYAGPSTPAEYRQTMTGCGSVLIWRR